jgi:hypothetical protein
MPHSGFLILQSRDSRAFSPPDAAHEVGDKAENSDNTEALGGYGPWRPASLCYRMIERSLLRPRICSHGLITSLMGNATDGVTQQME